MLLSRPMTDESKQELRCMVSKPSQLRPPRLVVVGSYKLDKLLEYLDVLEMSKDIV